jgi:predicted nuclease of restriction endonuclease-like (RecB) superfamily
MAISSPNPTGYAHLLSALKARIRAARLRASLSVNQELIELYWNIGQEILKRQDEEGWGTKVIDRLAVDLRRDFPEMTGLSSRNLKYMRALAEAYPDESFVQQVVARLPWGHNVRLIEAVKSPVERHWYARQTIEHGWSRNVLVHQIDSQLYLRQGKAVTNFAVTLPSDHSELAQQLIKDPYQFDFLSLGADISERDLERGLLDHLRSTILELGKGFAFVGSQYHIQVGDQDFYLDLLFYHLRLRCFVVFDLKIEEFKPEFAGKMNFYLSAVDDQLRHSADAPTIGIILCKTRNRVIVEYALRESARPMGVATYRLSSALPKRLHGDLPTAKEFEQDFPLLSVMQARIDVERAVRAKLTSLGIEPGRSGLSRDLQELRRAGLASPSLEAFEKALITMNQVAHGLSVDTETAELASKISRQFLDDLAGDAL